MHDVYSMSLESQENIIRNCEIVSVQKVRKLGGRKRLL